jgi:hypothetical protein
VNTKQYCTLCVVTVLTVGLAAIMSWRYDKPKVTPLTLQTEPLNLLPVPQHTNALGRAKVKDALKEESVWWRQ